MLRSKYIDRICCLAVAVMLVLTGALWGAVAPAQAGERREAGYESRLFDSSKVHTIDIVISDWDGLIANAQREEYAACDVVIDGEKFGNVAIRAKGNTSLSSVAAMDSTRYSFKIEFDHYAKGLTYHGLDKLSLNNLIQDATMMKDYLAYTLMNRMGVPAPLCSYVQINVNGEAWGLYLAVEGVEEGFLERNGMSKGELYKPDSMSFGGGRGNGERFDMGEFPMNGMEQGGARGLPKEVISDDQAGSFGGSSGESMPPEGAISGEDLPEEGKMPSEADDQAGSFGGSSGMPSGEFAPPNGAGFGGGMPDGQPASGSENAQEPPQMRSENGEMPSAPNFSGLGGMGSDDVKLIYSGDDPENYGNIFDNAKTDVSDQDQARLIEALRKLNEREDLEDTVDAEEVIRYLAVHNFLCNDDSYTGMMVHNYYLYEEQGKLSIIPWDYNLAFGGFSASASAASTLNSPIDSPVSSGTLDSRPLIAWIFEDEETLSLYHEVYGELVAENLENGWLAEEINRVQAMIAPYLERDSSTFYDMDAFEEAVETLQDFCSLRAQSIRGQLDGTIPSTSEGQKEDASALVDAGELSISAMGSMNTGAMGRGGMMNDREARPAANEAFDPADFAGAPSDGKGLGWAEVGAWTLILLLGLAVVKRAAAHN